MPKPSSTRKELIEEISRLKQRIQKLEQSESKCKRVEEVLRAKAERYRTLFSRAGDGIFLLSGDGTLVEVNESFARMHGYSMDEMLHMNLKDLNTPETFQLAPERMRRLWAGEALTFEVEHYHKDGHVLLLEVSASLISSGEESFLQSFHRDITTRKRAEEELRRNQDVTERLVQEIAIIAEIGKVVGSTLDTGEVYERFAAEVRKLIPFDRLSVNLHDLDQGIVIPVYVSGEYIVGRQPGDVFSLKGSVSEILVKTRAGMFSHPVSVEEMDRRFPNHSATIQAGMRSLLSIPLISRNEVIASLHFRSKKPNAYTEQDLRLAQRIGEQIAGAIANAQLYAGLKKTEHELKESEQRYRELSIIDDLTQLYNTRHFYFQLKIELDRSNRYTQPLTLLLFDLDNFKTFNDAYGHIEGDQVLFRLGQVVKRCLRETDFAYRYGGEEFTILLPMTTSADGVVTAERIRTELKREIFSPVPGQDVHVTVSIGLAQYTTKEDMKVFINRVDQLMYTAKKKGKDRVYSES